MTPGETLRSTSRRGTWHKSSVAERGKKKSLNRILERLNPPVSVLDGNDFFLSFSGVPLAAIRHPEA